MPCTDLTRAAQAIEVIELGMIVLRLVRSDGDRRIANVVILLQPCQQLPKSLVVPRACLLVKALRAGILWARTFDRASFSFGDGHVDQETIGIRSMSCDEVLYFGHPLRGHAIDVLA